MNTPRIIIVDNNQLFRQSLVHLFRVENIANVIGEASTGLEFMDMLTKNKPDLVLMSIPINPRHATEIMKKALQFMPDLKIIALSMFGIEEYRTGMIEFGVKGFLQKSGSINEFINAFCLVAKGENYFSSIKDSFN